MSLYKMGMIGDRVTSGIFSAIGIETAVVTDDPTSGKRELKNWIKSGKYGTIFITEELSVEYKDVLDEATYMYLPSIILIPSVKGSQGLASSIVRDILKKAAGRDIMAEEEQ